MQQIDFLEKIHTKTSRDYVQRVVDHDKGACAEVAKKWGMDYWDGDRQYGYGGYSYDGRWRIVAEEMAAHYNLRFACSAARTESGHSRLLFTYR